MRKIFGDNWRTTLAGIGLSILHLIAAGNHDPQTLAIAGGIAILGAVAKDPSAPVQQ
jgi:hypothetical protein